MMRSDTIDGLLRSAREASGAQGLVAVVETDAGRCVRATGDLTPQTAVPLGSVTKAYAATLLQLLAAKEYVSLGTRLASFLPAGTKVPRDAAGKDVTLLHLVTHSAGLPEESPATDPLAALATTTLEGEVGTRFRYSAFGYELLALALSRAAEKPFGDLLRDFLLKPLGAGGARYEDGQVVASADDLAMFLDLHRVAFKWKCLGFNTMQDLLRMHQVAVPCDGKAGGVGMGFRIANHPRCGSYLWEGGAGGFVALVPRLRVAVAALAPAGGGVAPLGLALLEAALAESRAAC